MPESTAFTAAPPSRRSEQEVLYPRQRGRPQLGVVPQPSEPPGQERRGERRGVDRVEPGPGLVQAHFLVPICRKPRNARESRARGAPEDDIGSTEAGSRNRRTLSRTGVTNSG